MFLKSLICLFPWLILATTETSIAKAGCQDTCGNISIPNPFGVGEPHCYQQSGLQLVCNESFNPPKLLYGNIPLVSISLLNGTMTVGLGVSYYCYDRAGELSDWQTWTFTLNENYYFSDTRNKFTAIGCDTNAVMSDSFVEIFKSGCMSVCANERSVVEGSCSGIGCCQTAIPKGLKTLNENTLVLMSLTKGLILRCIDIDECLAPENPCEKICTNTLGSFKCSCPRDYIDEGEQDGKDCIPSPIQNKPILQLALDDKERNIAHARKTIEEAAERVLSLFSCLFGVVLVELLTGKKHVCSERSPEERSLAIYFNATLKANRLFQLVEPQVIDEGKSAQIMAYSDLAKRCLHMKGEERPTMKEAAAELEGLRRFEMHPWALQRNEENMSLLSEPQDIYSIELSSYTGDASGQYSMEVMPMNVPPR
ncbi:hypothetical protein GIB67_033797 [Kingdonia uniflora]|uniref:EGF-like domain-containing protein n=1 Tax=Kingdonia uniflora TaxID=39325 RepID=A0A7J7P497_9MAGN|nr:hypothetical protein GIB67_033797 [Kingdonia uniflora]